MESFTHRSPKFACCWSLIALSLLAAILWTAQGASAQTFTLLHTFSGGADGGFPYAALTPDNAGNFYGAAGTGALGYGTVFKLTNRALGWSLAPVYSFHGNDGASPESPVIFGPDGALYGTTRQGGQQGVGTIYRLTPPQTFCAAVFCSWNERTLYTFTGGADGIWPRGHIVFDQHGNLFGTAAGEHIFSDENAPGGGPPGSVWQLVHVSSVWNFNVVHAFSEYGGDGVNPSGGVLVGSDGTLYGTTPFGGPPGFGTVFSMTPDGFGWSESFLHYFNSLFGGVLPQGGLVSDASGNMFGATFVGAYAYELTRSGSGWSFSTIAQLTAANGPISDLTIDAQGNLYGANLTGGRNGQGNVFKLSQSNGQWSYRDLYDFTGGDDGGSPFGSVVLNAEGNIYGTAAYGGRLGYGTVWMLTP